MTASKGSPEQVGQTAFNTALANNLQRHRLLPASATAAPRPVVIGVSGGADSVALLHAMVELSGTLNLQIHVAHVDHSLRPESSNEADFVRQLCERLDCDFHPHVLEPGSLHDQAGSTEAAARHARYAFLCQVAYNVTGAGQVPVLATAHHGDDQAETFLLHLVRGSRLRGLGGMRWKRQVTAADFDPQAHTDRIVWLIRPLLNLRREAIRAYLEQQGLAWCEDASNEDPAYTRNYLRHEVLPRLTRVNPQVVSALNRTAKIVADDVERLDVLDRRQLTRLLVEPDRVPGGRFDLDRIVLDLRGLSALPIADQRGVLRMAIAGVAQPIEAFGFEAVDGLLKRLQANLNLQQDGNSGPHPLGGNISWSVLATESTQRPLLSLHRAALLPVSSTGGPQLGTAWRPVSLSAGQKIDIGCWRLSVTAASVDEMPAVWQQVSPWEAWLDAEKIGSPTLTTPLQGMCIAPLGMDGRTKSVGDLFTDAKVHPTLRPGWPVVVDGRDDTVLWVCGQRIAHGARITKTTRRVLHLAWLRQGEARIGAAGWHMP